MILINFIKQIQDVIKKQSALDFGVFIAFTSNADSSVLRLSNID